MLTILFVILVFLVIAVAAFFALYGLFVVADHLWGRWYAWRERRQWGRSA